MIGAAGLCPSAGVTHFSLLLASYCSGVLRGKTAVLEWNGSGDFARILGARDPKHFLLPGNPEKRPGSKKCKSDVTFGGDCSFTIMDIILCAEAGSEELFSCKECCDYTVIDFGVLREEIRKEWLRCDRHVLLGSLSEWQISSLAGYLAGGMPPEGTEIFVTFGEEEKRRMTERVFGIPLRRIPFSPDAFTVNADVLEAFRAFLS